MKYVQIADGSSAASLGLQSATGGVVAVSSILQSPTADTATTNASVQLATETGSTAGSATQEVLNTRTPISGLTPLNQTAGNVILAWKILSIAGVQAWRGDYRRCYLRQDGEKYGLQNSAGSNCKNIFHNEDWPGNDNTRSTRRGREPGFWMLGTDCITYHQKTGGGAYQTPFINRQINEGLLWQDPFYRYRGFSNVEVRPALFGNQTPVVVLNTADGASIASTTPTLEFTGTDAESDDVTYEIQIATDTVFGSHLQDSYTVLGSSIFSIDDATYYRVGQSFTGDGSKIASVSFWLSNPGNVALANCFAKLWAHTGTFGSTGTPTGSALATSVALDIGTIEHTGVGQEVTFTFTGANQYQTTNGTNYFVTAEFPTAGSSTPMYFFANSAGTHGGNLATWDNVSWTAASGYDGYFKVTSLSTLVLDKLSASDAGFLNTVSGGDLDPFTQNNKISFTVQAGDALALATYYWRVQGKDSLGSGAWGDWSASRSFSVVAAAAPIPDIVIQPLLSPPKFK